MADEQQQTPAQDPLAEYDAKASASQDQAQTLPEQDLPANIQGLVPAEAHETTQHVLPKGLAVSKNNVHLPTGLVFDDEGTGRITAPPEKKEPAQPQGWFGRQLDRVKHAVVDNEGPGWLPYDIYMHFHPEEDPLRATVATPSDEEIRQRLKARNASQDPTTFESERNLVMGQRKERAILAKQPEGEERLISPEKFLTADEKKDNPIMYGVLHAVGGLSTQENMEIMAGSGGLGFFGEAAAATPKLGVLATAVSKLPQVVSAYFAGQMAVGVAQQIPGLVEAKQQYDDAIAAGDQKKADDIMWNMKEQAAEMGVNAYMTYAAAHHAATGHPEPAAKAASDFATGLTRIAKSKGADVATTAASNLADFTKSKFTTVADKIGSSLGKSTDFNELVTRSANMLGKKAGPEFQVKVKNVSEDLKAILNNDVDNKIVDPKSAAQAIDNHLKTAIDAPLLQEAGATKDSAEPVVPNFRQRLEERLDKFFSDTAGRYASGDQVEKAKERILDRVEMQHDFGNGITIPRDPNLFESENIRQGLNAEGASSPFEDSANIESNAYKAAARETAAFMRETIDEAYNAKGVRGVKEARSKEADLIDVRDALRDSQTVADKLAATPSILKLFSLGKMVGMIGAIGAHFASSNVLAGALATGTLWKHVHETNVRDVVGNLERAKAVAGREPGAQATVPQPGGPEVQGPSPAPPTPPVTPPPTAPEGFPPPPQPPAPVTPPETNHRLYGALSSYFGEFLGARPYKDLLQDFSNKVTDMRQDIKNQGGKYNQDQIDKASKLQEKINDAHAQEHEYVEKQNKANQAKYEKESAKYQQKLKAELTKQEQQRQTETQQQKDQVKASLLTDERIAHSPVLKATEEPLPIEGLEGRSSEQNHAHEHGHIMAASAEGLEPSQFVTDQHPDALEDDAAAQVHIDTSMAEEGPKGIAQKVVATLGGPAYDEVHSGIKMSKNFGARADVARARQLLREDGGLRGAALEKVFDALYDRAKEHISNPEALAIAQANMKVREAGLHPNYHMSAGRMAEYVKKLQGAYGNVKTQSTEVLREGDAGRGDEERESDLAGGTGKEQAGAVEGVRAEALRESGEGGGRKPGRLAKAAISKTPEAGKDLFEKAVKHYGTTEDVNKAGYIGPDGRMLDFSDGQNVRTLDHGDVSTVTKSQNPRNDFVADTGALRHINSRTYLGLHFDLDHPPTEAQLDRVLPLLKKGKAVEAEVSSTDPSKTRLSGIMASKLSEDVTDADGLHRVVNEAIADAKRKVSAKTSKEKVALKSAAAPEVADAANEYNRRAGREEIEASTKAHDPEFAKRVADAYDQMKHEPENPAVQKSYQAMAGEVKKQWDYATKEMGVKFEPWNKEGQPYTNSKEMMADVKDNKHLYFFQGGDLTADNPMAKVDPETGFKYMDMFRAVHDLFGHSAHGFEFGPKGEENAYLVHRQMFPEEAIPALTSETRGQNSWVNFGKHLRNEAGEVPKKGETGYVSPTERPYAKQKVGLLPEEFHGPKGPEPEGPKGGKKDWAEGIAGNLEKAPAGGVNPNNPETPSKRYGLELVPEVRKPLGANPTADDFRNYAKQEDVQGHLATHPDIKLGWDIGGEKPELNVGVSTDDKTKALDVAKKLDQRAMWDNQEEKEVPVGGAGKQTSFPDYPVENRLRDLGIEKVSLKKSPKGSSVPLMDNPLPVKGTMEGGEVGTLDLMKALNAYSRKQLPALEPGEAEPKEMVERAKKIAEDEAKYQLAQSKTGTEWYTTEIKEHDKVLQGLRPELASGPMIDAVPDHPVNLTLFKTGEGILSSGQKPYANVKSALRAWDLYKETGEFPPTNPETGKSWGPRGTAAYGNAFDAVNKLIAEKGEKGAADWLLSEHPVSELKNYSDWIAGKKDEMRPGALILGEKRGPFMQNLHGIESKFTADMWVARSWNRWMGTLDLEPRIEAKGKMTSESDAPRNNTERSLMKESFEKTAKKLKLTTSSLQAVLWYYEQALYRAHGLPVESWSFSDAAKRVASEQQSEEAQTSFPFGESAKGKGVEAGLSRLVQPSKFVNLTGK